MTPKSFIEFPFGKIALYLPWFTSRSMNTYLLYNYLMYDAFVRGKWSPPTVAKESVLRTKLIPLTPIAERFDLERRTLYRLLKSLETDGAVKRIPCSGKSSRYEITVHRDILLELMTLSEKRRRAIKKFLSDGTVTPDICVTGVTGQDPVLAGKRKGEKLRLEGKLEESGNRDTEEVKGETKSEIQTWWTPPTSPDRFTRAFALNWYRTAVKARLKVSPVIPDKEKTPWLTKKMSHEDFDQFYSVMSCMIDTWDRWKSQKKINEAYPPLTWYQSGWTADWLGWAQKHKHRRSHSGDRLSFL